MKQAIVEGGQLCSNGAGSQQPKLNIESALIIRDHLDFVILQAKQKQEHYKNMSNNKSKIDAIVHYELFTGFDQIFELYQKSVGEETFIHQLSDYMPANQKIHTVQEITSHTLQKGEKNDMKIKSIINQMKETALSIETQMEYGQIDNVTQLIIIEEEIDQILTSIENKKAILQLKDIKVKIRECQNQSKNYLVPALDLREQALNLYAVLNPEHMLQDQTFNIRDLEHFLSKALSNYASPQLKALINQKPAQDFSYDIRASNIIDKFNKVQLIEKPDSIYYGQVNNQMQPRGKGIQIGKTHMMQGVFGGGRLRILWDDGDEYIGSFVDGKKQGFGIYYYADSSSRFSGFWDEDLKKGYGIDCCLTSNEVLRGIWNDKDLILADSTKANVQDGPYKRQKTF